MALHEPQRSGAKIKPRSMANFMKISSLEVEGQSINKILATSPSNEASMWDYLLGLWELLGSWENPHVMSQFTEPLAL